MFNISDFADFSLLPPCTGTRPQRRHSSPTITPCSSAPTSPTHSSHASSNDTVPRPRSQSIATLVNAIPSPTRPVINRDPEVRRNAHPGPGHNNHEAPPLNTRKRSRSSFEGDAGAQPSHDSFAAALLYPRPRSRQRRSSSGSTAPSLRASRMANCRRGAGRAHGGVVNRYCDEWDEDGGGDVRPPARYELWDQGRVFEGDLWTEQWERARTSPARYEVWNRAADDHFDMGTRRIRRKIRCRCGHFCRRYR